MPKYRRRRSRSLMNRSRYEVRLLVEELEDRDLPSGMQPDHIIHPLQGGALNSSSPVGYLPAQIEHAYGFDQLSFNSNGTTVPANGSGMTIAIVDAYNDPSIADDLHQFDVTLNLPDPPSFSIFDQNGGQNLPTATNADWAGETALDVEWAHAIAPAASIDLLEANDNSNVNLYTAVQTAANLPGVVVVSMSFGGSEFPDQTGTFDTIFQSRNAGAGVTFIASSGDTGAPPNYPATSPFVLSVGGTTTNLDGSGNIISESAWGYPNSFPPEGSSGGLSLFEPQPVYQLGVVSQSSTARTDPDVSYDSDPDTGFPIYDTFNNPVDSPWSQIGGTSDAAPQWAGLIAITDQGRAISGLGSLDGFTQTLPMIYSAPAADFNDITSGASPGIPNYSAGPGYDLVTGIGTPVVNRLVPDLVGLAVTGSDPAVGSTINSARTSFTLNFSFPIDPSTLLPSAFTVNGLPASSVSLNAAGTAATFTYNNSPITNRGLYTMHLSAGSFSILGDPTATNVDFTGTFTYAINPVNHFEIIVSDSTVIAGTPFTVTVIAQDAFDNTVTNYTGAVHFAASDSASGVALPPNYTFGTADNGVHIFTDAITLVTAGNQTIFANDTNAGTVTGTSSTFRVNAGSLSRLAVNVPTIIKAGQSFFFAATALDNFNNLITSYSGTLNFASSDPQVSDGSGLPINATMTGGTGFFSAVLKTQGNQTITASDLTASITGTSNTVAVGVAGPLQFAVTPNLAVNSGVLSGPTSFAITGQPLSFTVKAVDPFGNLIPTYAGTVQFASSDSAASLPPPSTLTGGVGTFSATLKTPGTQTITATDTVNNSGPNAITGTSSIPTRGLVVTGFALTPGGFTLTFDRPFQQSTVDLYSNSGLPDDVILATAGSQVSVRGSLLINSPTSITFVKTNDISASGTFNPAAGLLAAGIYTLTLRTFSSGSSGFQDTAAELLDGNNSGVPGNNFQITFSVAAPPVAVGVPDFARGPSNADAIFLPPTLANGSTFALSYTNSAATPTAGTATITFSSNAATLQANIQAALTSGGLAAQVGSSNGGIANSAVFVTSDNSHGANVVVTFQGALAQATNQVLASNTPGVSIALASINVANNIPGNGIPIALSSGQGVTSGSFTLQYNPTLLNITGAVPGAAISAISGASFTLVSNTVSGTVGTVVLSFSSPSRISSTTTAITLGSLLGALPISATGSYGVKQLLHFTSEQLNGTSGPIAVTNQDGVQVVANLGDVTDTGGPLGLGDAVAVAAEANMLANATTQSLPGFAAFPDLDPAIIGDVSLQGRVSSADAGALFQLAAGTGRATIPYVPLGLPVTPTGPDPTLEVVGGQYSADSGTLTVGVDIDTARPQGSTGMVDAMLALSFNPAVFDVSASDIQLGTVPASGSGWQLSTQVNSQTGLVGIEISSATPIQSSAGGSLVTIAMHVRSDLPANAPDVTDGSPLTILSIADPLSGLRAFQTQVSDSQGAFVLHVADGGKSPTAVGDARGLNLQGVSQTISSTVPDNAYVPPSAAMDEVLGNLARTGPVQDAEFFQPAALFASEFGSQPPSEVRDLAQKQAAIEVAPPEWLPDALLAYQEQSALHGISDTPGDIMDGAPFFEDGADMENLPRRLK
jgi:hypothetical protein